jgi:hypothetical protein
MFKKKKLYQNDFYSTRNLETEISAQKVLTVLFKYFKPTSVVDFGCGVGTWLKVSKDLGIENILGLEGEWLNKNQLVISENSFMYKDLSKPVSLDKMYDMAISLEVAEHINPDSSNIFVDNLVNASDIVLFSAAIPHQRGTGHVNEQWHDYWIKIFSTKNYDVVDLLRPEIWNLKEVKTWYKQNILLFVNSEKKNLYPWVEKFKNVSPNMYSIVHPDTFLRQVELAHPKYMPLIETIKTLPYLLFKRVMKRFKKL